MKSKSRAWPIRTLRGMVGRIYVGDHVMLLHTKYLSSGPYGFREEDFLSISYYKSVGANEPRGMANLDPRAWSAGFMYVTIYPCLILNI